MWKPAPFSMTPMINHEWLQLFGAPGRQMTPKLVHKLGLRNVLGGRLGRELGFGGRCPWGPAEAALSGGTSLPHRSGGGQGALAGKHAAVPVPNPARIALAAWLALASARPCLLVVLTCAPAWGSTGGVVGAPWAMHALAVS